MGIDGEKIMRSTRIAVVHDYGIAGLIVDRLRDRGVRTMDVETSSHASVAGADQFYFIEILDEHQVEEARTALAEMGYQKNLL
jgi:hypothetical protein